MLEPDLSSSVPSSLSSKSRGSDGKKTFDFQISGLSYKLRTTHDEDVVRELVQFVERKIQEALEVSRSGSFQNAAVLAALNVAEELILLKRKSFQELSRLEQDIEKILQLKIPKKV